MAFLSSSVFCTLKGPKSNKNYEKKRTAKKRKNGENFFHSLLLLNSRTRIFICSFLDEGKREHDEANTERWKSQRCKILRNIMENKCKKFMTPNELWEPSGGRSDEREMNVITSRLSSSPFVGISSIYKVFTFILT